MIGPKTISVDTEFGSLASGGMKYHYSSDVGEQIFFTDGVKIEVLVD